jgi:DegV family protein with EDD domain
MNSKGDPDTMAIRIITDSASDITQVEAAAWGVQVLPLRTIFGQEEFLDGITIDHETFFQKLIESDVLPTTSQLSPFQYEEPFRQAAEAGDEVVCITLSSKLSGCYQSASIAAGDLPVVLVDSLNVTIGERLLVERAVQLRDQGLSAREIGRQLEEEKSQIRLIALLDTLEYLKKGGRISSAAALAGSLLSIKPVIAVEHGEIAILGKARGSKTATTC